MDKNKEVEKQATADLSSHKDINSLQKELDSCLVELDRCKDQYLHITADFDNYKRRSKEEKMYWLENGQALLLVDLLTIIDDFHRAAQHDEKVAIDKACAELVHGYALIGKELDKLLDKYQVKEVEQYDTFDPEIHEALTQVESADHTSGDIVTVMQKGYTFKDKLIRPAKVTVAK